MNKSRIKEILANLGRTELSRPMDAFGKNNDLVLMPVKKSSILISDLYNPSDSTKLPFASNTDTTNAQKMLDQYN